MNVWKCVIPGVQALFGLAPVAVAVAATQQGSWFLVLMALVAVFVVVALFPLYRKRESLWIFVLVFLVMTPVNIATYVAAARGYYLFYTEYLIINIMQGMLWFLIAMCLEELVCGVIARLLWRRQHKSVMMRIWDEE